MNDENRIYGFKIGLHDVVLLGLAIAGICGSIIFGCGNRANADRVGKIRRELRETREENQRLAGQIRDAEKVNNELKKELLAYTELVRQSKERISSLEGLITDAASKAGIDARKISKIVKIFKGIEKDYSIARKTIGESRQTIRGLRALIEAKKAGAFNNDSSSGND